MFTLPFEAPVVLNPHKFNVTLRNKQINPDFICVLERLVILKACQKLLLILQLTYTMKKVRLFTNLEQKYQS